MRSLNQIYKESSPKMPFRDWLVKGQEIYNWKKAEGSIPNEMTFEQYANQKFLNADAKKKFGDTLVGQILKGGVKVGADVIKQKEDAKANASPSGVAPTTSDYSLPAKTGNTVLGMKPIVFYPVMIVTLVGVGFGVWKLVKHFQK
jgi:hypothetical protein